MTSNHAEQARARKMADALACGIDDAFISQLVESFYDTVRQDDTLGPIFAERIGVAAILTRMKDFWASIMLRSVGSAAIRCASISRSASLMRRISRAGSRSGTRRLLGSRRTLLRSRIGFAKRHCALARKLADRHQDRPRRRGAFPRRAAS